MPYQTGSFSSFADLQTTVESFCTTNGWTLTAGVLAKAGCHVKVISDASNRLLINVGDGDDGFGTLTNPVPYTFRMLTSRAGQSISFPATYHLFSLSDPEHIFLVINYNVSWCQHMAFGNVKKYGTWSGGQIASSTFYSDTSTQKVPDYYTYFYSTYSINGGGAYLYFIRKRINYTANPSAGMLCDIDDVSWLVNTDGSAPEGVGVFAGSSLAMPYLNKSNSINLQPAMFPAILTMSRPSNLRSVIATVPHVRYLRVDNYQPGDIIEVGSQKWMVFPHISVSFNGAGWAIKYDGP